MQLLIAGLVLFLLTHLVPSFPTVRAGLVSKLKPGGYKKLFSVLSLVSIVLIVYGLTQATFKPLYAPPGWGRHVAMLLMLPALYLFFSNSFGSAPSSAKVFTAHPMNWGIIVWAVAHLLANGDVAHVLLFGVLLVFSAIGIVTGNARGQKPALQQRPAMAKEFVFILGVVVIYGVLLWAHKYFTGMPLLSI